jgi:hypothetical protein
VLPPHSTSTEVIAPRPAFWAVSVSFFYTQWKGETIDLFANLEEEQGKWTTSKFHVWTIQTMQQIR